MAFHITISNFYNLFFFFKFLSLCFTNFLWKFEYERRVIFPVVTGLLIYMKQ